MAKRQTPESTNQILLAKRLKSDDTDTTEQALAVVVRWIVEAQDWKSTVLLRACSKQFASIPAWQLFWKLNEENYPVTRNLLRCTQQPVFARFLQLERALARDGFVFKNITTKSHINSTGQNCEGCKSYLYFRKQGQTLVLKVGFVPQLKLELQTGPKSRMVWHVRLEPSGTWTARRLTTMPVSNLPKHIRLWMDTHPLLIDFMLDVPTAV